MKIYVKGKDYATFQVDETWVETEDEIVETPLGQQLKSYTLTQEFAKKLQKHEINNQILQLKQNLTNTDYQAIKYAEGQISEQDYASIKAQRQSWRDEINELEKEVS